MIEYLTIKMRCLNAAFDGEQNRSEIGRILRRFAAKIEDGQDPEILLDVYGNRAAFVEYQHAKEN